MLRAASLAVAAVLLAEPALAQTPGPAPDVERQGRTRPPPPVTDVQPGRTRPAPTPPGAVQAAPPPASATLTPTTLLTPIARMRLQRPAYVEMMSHNGQQVPIAYFSTYNPMEYDIWIEVDVSHLTTPRGDYVNVEMIGFSHTTTLPCLQLPAVHPEGITGFSSHYQAPVIKLPDGTIRVATTAATENGKGTVRIRRCNQENATDNYTLLSVRIH